MVEGQVTCRKTQNIVKDARGKTVDQRIFQTQTKVYALSTTDRHIYSHHMPSFILNEWFEKYYQVH